jgi:hypothetical protein
MLARVSLLTDLDVVWRVQVLRKLAKEHYNNEEGARAVVSGVNNTVTMDIKCALLEERLTADGGMVMIMGAEDPAESYELELDGKMQ